MILNKLRNSVCVLIQFWLFILIYFSGAWICLNNITNIKPEVLSVCAQLLASIYDAMRAGKGVAHLHTEEVQLHAEGACFAVIDTGIKVCVINDVMGLAIS